MQQLATFLPTTYTTRSGFEMMFRVQNHTGSESEEQVQVIFLIVH